MKALDCPEITVEALGELGAQLGGGGVSVVYRATWKGQPVAVKLTQEEANDALVEEYRNELQVMTQLDHPNIIRLLGASLVPPKLCIVMELCVPAGCCTSRPAVRPHQATANSAGRRRGAALPARAFEVPLSTATSSRRISWLRTSQGSLG